MTLEAMATFHKPVLALAFHPCGYWLIVSFED